MQITASKLSTKSSPQTSRILLFAGELKLSQKEFMFFLFITALPSIKKIITIQHDSNSNYNALKKKEI